MAKRSFGATGIQYACADDQADKWPFALLSGSAVQQQAVPRLRCYAAAKGWMICCSVARLGARACGRLGNRACGKEGNCPFALLGKRPLGGASAKRAGLAPRGVRDGNRPGAEIDSGLAFPLG